MIFSFKKLAVMGILAAGALDANLVGAATFPCINLDVVTPQTEIPFVGFRDLCGDTDLLPYDGASSATGMMIDARNSADLWFDTARYKRYGTYNPPSQVDWEVSEGFSNFWTQVYYAEDNADQFGHMRYFVSEDGNSWEEVTGVQRSKEVSTNGTPAYRGYWFMKQEQQTLPKSYTHFRALWPAPCQGEVDDPNTKSCITLGVPDDQKDIYFAPQLGEVLLGRDSTTMAIPENVALEVGSTSMVVSWSPPANAADQEILGYSLYYMEAPPLTTDPEFDTLKSYDFDIVNLPNVNSVQMAGLKPETTYVVRVEAINKNGAGELSGTVWSETLMAGDGNDVDSKLDTCEVVDIPTELPSKRGFGDIVETTKSPSSGSSSKSGSDSSSTTTTSGSNVLRPVLLAVGSVMAIGVATVLGF